MMLDPRLAVYLFKIGQKLHRRERVHALMKCPECDTYAHHFTPEQAAKHVMIKQRIFNNNRKYRDILYCVIGCNGYWIVDPETLGMARGNWEPLYEVIKRQLAD